MTWRNILPHVQGWKKWMNNKNGFKKNERING
jgi:hypothetical protein